MPQPEMRARKPSAKQAVLKGEKLKNNKNTKTLNAKPRKKKRTGGKKRSVDHSSTEKSSSEDETQPQKRQKKSLEPEEISVPSDSLDEESEVILVSETSDTNDKEVGMGEDDDTEMVNGVHDDVPVSLNAQLVLYSESPSNTSGN